MSIIHKDNLTAFRSKGLYVFNDEIACQGAYWPDAKILDQNGDIVREVAVFDHIFELLSKKKCTYFPRAIFEGYAELEAVKERFPDLTTFDDALLHCALPYFFYTNKKSTGLAEQLHFGLSKALKNGSYDALMKQHPLTRHLYPLKQWQNKTFISFG